MTTVLVLAHSPEIEALLADLVVFAGYHPVFVRDDETPTDAMRRRGADAVLVDASLAWSTVSSCEATARARGIAVVYVASTMSAGELRTFADARHACHFPLPNGPKLLQSVLYTALAQNGRQAAYVPGAPPAALVSALGAIAQARRLSLTARTVIRDNRQLRDEKNALLDEARGSLDQLHEAVLVYLQRLRSDGLSRELASEALTTAIRESAEAAGAPELLGTIVRDAEHWIEEAYRAA